MPLDITMVKVTLPLWSLCEGRSGFGCRYMKGHCAITFRWKSLCECHNIFWGSMCKAHNILGVFRCHFVVTASLEVTMYMSMSLEVTL